LPTQLGCRNVALVSDVEAPRQRRRGLGCVPSLALLLVLGVGGVVIVESIIGPWIYTVGGRHRWLPLWEGVGDVAGPGGSYRLYVWFSPSSAGQRILPETSVRGSATLCTPRGERFNLRLRGGAHGRQWLHVDGPFSLEVWRRKALGRITGPTTVAPPRLHFDGRWDGPNLVMDDTGSFSHAFKPDGTLNENAGTWHPKMGAVPITFTETHWGFISAPPCPVVR
jgi:hypothetical protein